MGPDNMRLEAIIIDNTGTLTAGPLADRPQNTWNRFPVWLWEYTDRPHGRPASTAEQNRYYVGCWNRGHTPRQFLSRDRDTLDQEWAAMPAPDQWQQPRHLQGMRVASSRPVVFPPPPRGPFPSPVPFPPPPQPRPGSMRG